MSLSRYFADMNMFYSQKIDLMDSLWYIRK